MPLTDLLDAPSVGTRLDALGAIDRTAPCARAALAMDEPIRPTPISASVSKSGLVIGRPRRSWP